jgi:hypothetical protein
MDKTKIESILDPELMSSKPHTSNQDTDNGHGSGSESPELHNSSTNGDNYPSSSRSSSSMFQGDARTRHPISQPHIHFHNPLTSSKEYFSIDLASQIEQLGRSIQRDDSQSRSFGSSPTSSSQNSTYILPPPHNHRGAHSLDVSQHTNQQLWELLTSNLDISKLGFGNNRNTIR